MTKEHSVSPADNRRGMIAITVGMAGYTFNDTIVKVIARDLPLGEIIFQKHGRACWLAAVSLAGRPTGALAKTA